MTEMTDTQFDQACDELMDLLVDLGLSDGMSCSLRDRTCIVDLYGEQVVALAEIIRSGRGYSLHTHPSNALVFDHVTGTVHAPAPASNGHA